MASSVFIPPRPAFLAKAVVVVPALNEAPCITATVRHWLDCGSALVRVVDNGSADETSTLAALAGAEVLREPRRGYGAAVWCGAQNLPAAVEWIVFSSADGSDQMDEASATAFQRAIDSGAQLVLGERVSLPDSRRHLSVVQRFGNALCCRLIALGWNHSFRDMASMRAIRVDAFVRLALEDRGFGWNVEMQVRAVEHGLRIAEAPVQYRPRTAGEPKISGSFVGIVRAARGILVSLAGLYASGGKRRRDRQATTRI